MASASGQDLGQDLNETIYEKLKCYICESRLQAGKHHWYRCTQAHLICQDCREVKEKKNCSCTKYIPLQHCEFIEALLNVDKMQFKCENLSRGCQENMEKDDMIFHQTECIYRLVKCPLHKCEVEVPFHELLEHMETTNCCTTIITKTTFGKKVKEYHLIIAAKPLPERVEIENKNFFISFKVKDGLFYHWVQFLGSPHEANNFSYTLEYFEKESEKIAFSQTSNVFSIDETVESILENGKCLGAPVKYFRSKILAKRGRFDFNYEIRNLKEEVKDDNVESGVSDVDE